MVIITGHVLQVFLPNCSLCHNSKIPSTYNSSVQSIQRLCTVTYINDVSIQQTGVGQLSQGHFTHIFIDEAGHAVEPECTIPVIGLLDPNNARGGTAGTCWRPQAIGTHYQVAHCAAVRTGTCTEFFCIRKKLNNSNNITS